MILFALLGWPILTIILARNLPWPNALIASLVGGYLLLPEQGGIDLPLLPALDKSTIPCLTLFILALILRPGQKAGVAAAADDTHSQKGWLPKSLVGQFLLMLIIVGAFMTALTNGDRLRFSGTGFSIPGLGLYDGFSIIVRSTALILPVLLGRKYLASTKGHELLLVGLVIAGLCYSLLALIEVRLSPQMNRWVYGFFPHSWHQHVRGDGYRPLVFLSHGLWLAIFFAMTILAAFGLSRSSTTGPRTKWFFAGGWLLLTLALCNSLGALVISVLLVPVIMLTTTRVQLLSAGIIAGIVLTFPLLRGADLVPTDALVELAANVSDDRSRSLNFRFRNEDELIQKANERPLFGWGSFGRNRIYDEFGNTDSVVDGAWIVSIGQGGWIRYLGEFGLLSVPLILFAIRRKSYDAGPATAALCLVLAANMIDLIPNGTRTPLTWLVVGALLGRLELGRDDVDTDETDDPDSDSDHNSVSPYTRQRVIHDRKRLSRNAQE